jgi:hypothetical protein
MTVAEPFERGGAQTYAWSQIAQDQGARLVLDSLVAVDAAERSVLTHAGGASATTSSQSRRARAGSSHSLGR